MLEDKTLKWFAARMIRESSYVLKYLECEKCEFSRIKDLSTLIFIHCSQKKIEQLRYQLFDRVMFYRNAGRTELEPIPNNVMRTFLLLEPFHDEPVIYLPVDDPHFFEGPRYRVISGPFAGCEGTVKRLKGDRRLIVRISSRAAIATPFIHPALLERIGENLD